nr:ribonuclease H-like domain-containing protein [Tanacetum cinerariifolium]
MVTRFRVGTNRPTKRYACHVSPISPLLKSYTHAFNDPYWYRAMRDEYNALIKNKTWILVSRPHNVNIVRCLWLFRHKHNADGCLNRYKARLVANGSSQLVDETFSPVVKPATIRIVLSLAISRYWPVHQLDGTDIAYLLLYVDDIVLTASFTAFLQRIITSLHAEFSMTDLGPLNYFLGVSVTLDISGMFLSQQKYATFLRYNILQIEAFNVAIYLLNILASTAINNDIPHTRLFGNIIFSIMDQQPTPVHIPAPVDLTEDEEIAEVNTDELFGDNAKPRPSGKQRPRKKQNPMHRLNRYKACLVANGSSQLVGIDVDETFSPVVKPATIRTVLSLAISRYWPVHQLDVKNAFLNGYLSETVYMQQPPASFTTFLQWIITFVHAVFSMTDLGPLNYFLGVSVTRDTSRMFLSQQKYATKVLERTGMLTCNPYRTPVDTDSKLSADGDPVFDPTLYRSLAGALQYLAFTRPYISYAVHFTRPRPLLWLLIQMRIGLRQFTISCSSAEAEYRGVANAVAETCWLRNLLLELHTPLSTATLVYCDNVSAVYLFSNPVQHQRTKHIEIDIHFVGDLVFTGRIRVLHVPSLYQYADIFTKRLPISLFDEFRSILSVRSSFAQTAGGC